jgi:hypothetical protein
VSSPNMSANRHFQHHAVQQPSSNYVGLWE